MQSQDLNKNETVDWQLAGLFFAKMATFNPVNTQDGCVIFSLIIVPIFLSIKIKTNLKNFTIFSKNFDKLKTVGDSTVTSGSKNQEMFEYYRLTNGRYKPVKTLKYLNIGDILDFCGITRTEKWAKN